MPVENQRELPFLTNLGLVITYKCQIACSHCILEASPRRTEEMELTDARQWIHQASSYRNGQFKVLSLTGGEPFYNLDLLRQISDIAEKAGLLVTVVTNAFWAFTRETALDTLKSIPAVRMLAVSADAYHQAEIPIERVQHAVAAAQQLELEYSVAVCTENEQDETYLSFLRKLEAFVSRDRINTATTLPVGRGATSLKGSQYEASHVPASSACWAASTPMIFPDGRVVACIGPVISLRNSHPLLLGNAKRTPLSEILDQAQLNPILHALRVWGPSKLIDLLGQSGWADLLPNNYIKGSVCAACYSLMSDCRVIVCLNQLAQDPNFVEKVAYGRLYYLKEEEMAVAISSPSENGPSFLG